MSTTPVAGPAVRPVGAALRPRRVREQVRDALVLMAFSLALSLTCALGLLLLARLGR